MVPTLKMSDETLQKFASFEKNWGILLRWVVSGLLMVGIWGLISFGDNHYIRRVEFGDYRSENATALREISGKLDSVIIGQATTTQHVLDIQNQLDRADNSRAGKRVEAGPQNFAGK